MKLKDKYWEIIKQNLGYRQTLFEWQFAALKAKKPTDKIDNLIAESRECENFIVLLFAKLERMEKINSDLMQENYEAKMKVIELENIINVDVAAEEYFAKQKKAQ